MRAADKSQGPKYNAANVQKIVYQIITEPAQHAIALQTGSADVSGAVSSADASQFKDSADFSNFTFLANLTQLIVFNGSEGNPFTNKDLRQAVAYAIDTKGMCEAVSPGACAPAHTIGNSNFGGYMTKWDTEPYYDFDLAKAKELFAASGHNPGDLSIKLVSQNDPRSGLMAQIIQSQLKELGITVEINQVESSVYNQFKTDPMAFDMLIDAAAGGDFIVNFWQLFLPWSCCWWTRCMLLSIPASKRSSQARSGERTMLSDATLEVKTTKVKRQSEFIVVARRLSKNPMAVVSFFVAVLLALTQEYLEAATSVNTSTPRIIVRHVLPNSFSPLLVSATMSIGDVIMAAAMLSFIGLGVQPPTPEWSSMIAGGRSLIRTCPWMVTFPGIFIMLTVLALNLFGDGLRDALDPKLKK